MIVVGVDIGGTFTDLMLYDTASEAVHVHKVRSTPAEPERAMVEGLSSSAPRPAWTRGTSGRLPRDHRRHERRAHVRGRDGGDDHESRLPGHRSHRAPPAPRALLDHAGHPVAGPPLRAAAPPQGRLGAARPAPRASSWSRWTRRCASARELREAGVEAVAVCLLFSYLNPERRARGDRGRGDAGRVRDDQRGHLTAVPEFERFTTACMNAFVGP